MHMDGLTTIIAAIATAWLWRKHTATAPSSPAAPEAGLSPVYRIALGMVIGFCLLTALLFVIFIV